MTRGKMHHVLLLDDDELWLRSLKRLLTRAGTRCDDHVTPESALEALEANHAAGDLPALCVVDYALGRGWTGARFAQEAHARLGEQCPPLVLVSGTAELVGMEDRRLFHATYAKTLEPDALLAELRLVLNRREGRPRSHSRASARSRRRRPRGPCSAGRRRRRRSEERARLALLHASCSASSSS